MATARSRKFLFSPPSYLLMPAVGIDISDRSIKYAELVPAGRGSRLGRFGDIALAPGIVEGGRIVSPQKLTDALTELRKKEKLSFVRAALPEEQMYFFRTEVPTGTHAAMRESLELTLEDHVPIPAMETTFDFEVITDNGTTAEVAVTAASEIIIQSYRDTFLEAGLTLLSLELEAEAVVRSVTHTDDAVARLVVDFGETRTGIAVGQYGHVEFTSTVAMGGKMLNDTLAKHFNVSIEEAEKLKREVGLRRTAEHQDLFSLLLNNIAVLRDEINRHFLYWHSHPDEHGKSRSPIEEIILVGGDSNLAGLTDYLGASLNVKVSIGNVWTNVVLPDHGVPAILHNDSLAYATAIGLALHGAMN